MILLHIFLIFNLLLHALSDPNLPRALARINEARARALSNRARIRANNARIMNQIHSSGSSRSKRQFPENFEEALLEHENPDFEKEPVLLHICSVDEPCDLNHFRSSENSGSQVDEALDQAYEKLTEAQKMLKELEENAREAAGPYQKNVNPVSGSNEEFSPETMKNSEGTRDADAHLHSHIHQHSKIHSHGVSSLTPYQIPHAQIAVPGLNLNINQNQGLLQPGLHQQGLLQPGLHQQGLLQPGLHQQGLHQSNLHQSNLHQSSLHQSVLHQPILPHHGAFSPLSPIHTSTVLPTVPTGHLRNFDGGEIDENEIEDMVPSVQEVDVDSLQNLDEEKISRRGDAPTFDPFHQKDSVMDFLSKHNFRQTLPVHYENREADPTIHKIKKLKMKKLEKLQPQYYPTYQTIAPYNHYYREAEHVEIPLPPEDENEEIREADPTIHKLKQKKLQKLLPVYLPAYPAYPNTNPYTQYYRNSDQAEGEDVGMPFFLDSEESAREADPTIHKLKKLKQKKMQKIYPQYYPSYQHSPYSPVYRSTEEELQQEDEDPLKSPFLFDFPSRRVTENIHDKRSTNNQIDEILRKQRKIVDTLSSKNDEDLKLVMNIANRTLTDVENRSKKLTKRSIPLTRLISDPSVRLDVPKTIENFGTATKHAFEDERAPMYHFKHLVGASKNAILSAMRIPPQNMIIPSDYEIVRKEDRPSSRNKQDDPMGFSNTFRRVGEMVRDSIKSGQDTASHIGDIAHDARNILNSARHAAPRLIIPYSQIPAIQNTRRKTPSKAILITPRIVDLTHDDSSKRHSDARANFVRLGHLMDAVGITKPNSKSLDLEKIIFEPRRMNQAKVDEKLAHLYSKFRDNFHDDADTVGEAISTLEDAKISVGAKNLRDFLVKMRRELTSMVRTSPEEHKKKHKSKKKKLQETREMGKFIEKLFDGSTKVVKNDTVGAGLYLPPELLHPFMGRASESQLHDFFRENGDEEMITKHQSPSEHYQHHYSEARNNTVSLGYVLGAINPLMLERMYNQTVHIKDNNIDDPETLFNGSTDPGNGSTVGTFAMNGPILKPFMGQVQPEAIEKFLDTYNHPQDSLEEEE